MTAQIIVPVPATSTIPRTDPAAVFLIIFFVATLVFLSFQLYNVLLKRKGQTRINPLMHRPRTIDHTGDTGEGELVKWEPTTEGHLLTIHHAGRESKKPVRRGCVVAGLEDAYTNKAVVHIFNTPEEALFFVGIAQHDDQKTTRLGTKPGPGGYAARGATRDPASTIEDLEAEIAHLRGQIFEYASDINRTATENLRERRKAEQAEAAGRPSK